MGERQRGRERGRERESELERARGRLPDGCLGATVANFREAGQCGSRLSLGHPGLLVGAPVTPAVVTVHPVFPALLAALLDLLLGLGQRFEILGLLLEQRVALLEPCGLLGTLCVGIGVFGARLRLRGGLGSLAWLRALRVAGGGAVIGELWGRARAAAEDGVGTNVGG